MEKLKDQSILILCLFLWSCLDSNIEIEFKNGASNKVSGPRSLSFNVEASLDTYIVIDDETLGNYRISYQLGTTPPSDCTTAQVTSSGVNRVLVPSLTPDSIYSFRVCRKVGEAISSGVTVTLMTSALNVSPSFAGGSDWNEWVEASDTSSLCTGATVGFDSCLHAGESRDVSIPTFESCVGLTLEDQLNLFDWSCIEDSGSIYFRSELKTATKVTDLIDGGNEVFYENAVSLKKDGEVLYNSTPSIWWSNSLVHIQASSNYIASIDGQIYFIKDAEVLPYNIDLTGDNITLLTLGNSYIEGDNTSATALNIQSSASMSWIEARVNKVSGAGGDAARLYGKRHKIRKSIIRGGGDDCVQAGGGSSYNQIQDTSFGGCNFGLFFTNSSYVKVQNVEFDSCNTAAFEINNSSNSIFKNIEAQGIGTVFRILSAGSFNNKYLNVKAASMSSGITFGGSSSANNLFMNIKLNNIQNKAITMDATGVGNNFIDISAVGGTNTGIEISGATGGTNLINVLAAFNQGSGIHIENSQNINIVNTLSMHNSRSTTTQSGGFMFSGTDSITCVNCAALSNNNYGFNLAAGTGGEENNAFKGLFLSSGNNVGNCNVETQAATTNPGLVDSTCTSSGSYGSSDFVGALSDAKFYDSIDISTFFVGSVVDDQTNTDGASLPIQASSISDWINFDSKLSFWVRNDISIGTADPSTACTTSQLCDILNLALDTENPSANMLLARSFDFESGNISPSSSSCPAAVNGTEYVDSQISESFVAGINAIEISGDGFGDDDDICESTERCFSRFLKHATELIADDIGDDDGLCEANEACRYNPNIGIYQGQGDYLANECDFESPLALGTGVSNVTMYYYPSL